MIIILRNAGGGDLFESISVNASRSIRKKFEKFPVATTSRDLLRRFSFLFRSITIILYTDNVNICLLFHAKTVC